MVDFFLFYDRLIFQFINSGIPRTDFFDTVFSIFSGIGDWGVVWIVFLIALYFIGKIRGKNTFFVLLFALCLSLLLSEFLLKNIFQRARPEVTLPFVHLLTKDPSTYSFPSSHATLAFAGAYVLSQGHKKLQLFYFLVAFLIGFSRIYLGKHYPSDVFVGAVVGLIVGVFSVKIADFLLRQEKQKK